MRNAIAKSLRKSVYAQCRAIAHPNPKRVYNRVKKAFLATPRPQRKDFNYQTGTVT